MSFNATKCSVMHVLPSSRKQLFQTSYIPHGHTLGSEEDNKYLGITLDSHLNWDRHISNVVSKGKGTLGFLRSNFKACTISVKAATYTTIVCPAMEYASSVWDPHQQHPNRALDQVQGRAAGYVYNIYTDRTSGCVTRMINDFQWENLQERRRISRPIMLYKIRHGLVNVNANSYLKQSDNRTRSSNRFYQEESYFISFFPRTVRDWNQLPPQLGDLCNQLGGV